MKSFLSLLLCCFAVAALGVTYSAPKTPRNVPHATSLKTRPSRYRVTHLETALKEFKKRHRTTHYTLIVEEHSTTTEFCFVPDSAADKGGNFNLGGSTHFGEEIHYQISKKTGEIVDISFAR